MSKGSIKDPSIKLKPSQNLIDFMATLGDEYELPENIWKFVEITGVTRGVNATVDVAELSFSQEEVKHLNDLPNDNNIADNLNDISVEYDDSDELNDKIENFHSEPFNKTLGVKQKILRKESQGSSQLTLNLNDIKWLNVKLSERRNLDPGFTLYLNELLIGSRLVLPKNEILERNPILEARCARLRLEQEARMYNAMTKNVDSSRTKLPEDTVSYQIKQINRQLIAVAQFIFSIAAGFAFGFIGVELMIGNLDFGFRLLLGILCALIIALAEIYFLAKKLNEEYEASMPTKVNIIEAVPNKCGAKEHLE